MKPIVKFALILAAALGVLGLAGIGVGMAMGARPAQFLNLAHYDHSIFRWLDDHTDRLDDWADDVEDWADEWSDDVDDWVNEWTDGVEEGAERWGEGHHEGNLGITQLEVPAGDDTDAFEDSFSAEEIKKIKLELNTAVLRIYAGEEGSEISLKGRNGLNYFQARQEKERLELTDTRTWNQYQRNGALELELWIPSGSFQEIELDLGASDVEIERLEAEEIKIDVGAGLLRAETLTCAEVKVDAGMGSGSIERLSASKKAELDVGAGELTVDYFAGGDLELDCGVGTLDMTAAGRDVDYNYELDCGIGTITMGSRSFSGLDRSQIIDNGASKKVEADCGIGTITLDFEEN